MSNFDIESIKKKAETYLSSTNGKKEVSNALDKKIQKGGKGTPERAAVDFVNILKTEIHDSAATSGRELSNGGLGRTAIEALTNIEYTKPRKISDNQYAVDISFAGDLSRPSLVPAEHRSYGYDDIKNIAALLNNGYGDENTMQVRGVWHGKKIKSLPHRSGSFFVTNAITRFKNDFQKKYKIVDIRADSIYK